MVRRAHHERDFSTLRYVQAVTELTRFKSSRFNVQGFAEQKVEFDVREFSKSVTGGYLRRADT